MRAAFTDKRAAGFPHRTSSCCVAWHGTQCCFPGCRLLQGGLAVLLSAGTRSGCFLTTRQESVSSRAGTVHTHLHQGWRWASLLLPLLPRSLLQQPLSCQRCRTWPASYGCNSSMIATLPVNSCTMRAARSTPGQGACTGAQSGDDAIRPTLGPKVVRRFCAAARLQLLLGTLGSRLSPGQGKTPSNT